MLNPNNKFIELSNKIQDFGFDGVLYSFFPKAQYLNNKNQPLFHYCENFEPFIRHYTKNNYGNNDFVMRLIYEKGLGVIDWWQEVDAGNISVEESKITIDAKNNFNIQNGLTLPVLNNSFTMSAISIISKNTNKELFASIKKKHIDDLKELAMDYHLYILSSKEKLKFFVEHLFSDLNQTKKIVVKHLISGKPMKSIEIEHSISQKYAEKTLANIRSEFGNISTNEFIYALGVCGAKQYL
jgi:hypothetical protein